MSGITTLVLVMLLLAIFVLGPLLAPGGRSSARNGRVALAVWTCT